MPASPSDVWSSCLSRIKEHVQPQSFRTWFEPVDLETVDPNSAVFLVPDTFFRDWMEEHYAWLIENALHDVTGWRPRLAFQPAGERASRGPVPFSGEESTPSSGEPVVEQMELLLPLNSRYRFENFVVGGSNEFAFTAARAVAEAPGRTNFNPLVIYSGVGLGKTHLLQAIGDYCVRNRTAKRVLYVTAEKFISDYIASIRMKDTTEFVNTYRTADVLLVDDIQFFLQTEGTQREFFHTFNALFQNDKQIVLTSDCPPPSLKGFEERLISRFQCGLVASIDQPDLETRIAILNKKAEARGVTLPHEVGRILAECQATNVRELEGALTQMLAKAQLDPRGATPELARECCKEAGRAPRSSVNIARIQEIAAEHFEIPVEKLIGASRKQELAQARHVAMYLCKSLTGSPLKSIGSHFGRRDHSTVIHACKSVEKRLAADPGFRDLLDSLREKITRRSVG